MTRRFLAATCLTLLTACGAAGSSTGTDTATDPVDTTVPGGGADTEISWKPCESDSSLKCARFSVPYDWSDPSVGSFSLYLVMRPANMRTARIGSMLVNPGGPGFGGSHLAMGAENYFSSDLLDRFDIVGFDPRGTGESTPAIDCVDNYDPYFAVDPTPDNEEEREALIDSSKLFAEECAKRSGEILPWISTNAAVRDMNAIRAALGEDKISYFGFSYGSELGATWATMFPDTVRVAVLDGATDPDADYVQSGLDQAVGFEKQLDTFLERCSKDATCPFHNGSKTVKAFDALMAALDDTPLVVSKTRAPVNLAVAMTAVAQAMYSSTMWEELEYALDAAQKGDGKGLLALNDQYYQRDPEGTYDNELEAFNAISCLDDPGPTTIEESEAQSKKFFEAAPRMAPGFTGGYGCVFWPAEADRRIEITGKGAGPIVVIGTTGDAATPLASSRKMADKLEDGRLVVVTANRHTGYGENACVVDAVDAYVITTKITFEEKAC